MEFEAPKKPGLYLVEQCIDLECYMKQARRNKLQEKRNGNEEMFIAWVEVIADGSGVGSAMTQAALDNTILTHPDD